MSDEGRREREILFATSRELGDHEVMRLETHCSARLGVGTIERNDAPFSADGKDCRGHGDSLAEVAKLFVER